MSEKKDGPWVVRDVPERTRRKVKAYAAERGITMAQAVEFLVDAALRDPKALTAEVNHAMRYFKRVEERWPSQAEAIGLLARLAEIDELGEAGIEPEVDGLDIDALIKLGLLDRDPRAMR